MPAKGRVNRRQTFSTTITPSGQFPSASPSVQLIPFDSLPSCASEDCIGSAFSNAVSSCSITATPCSSIARPSSTSDTSTDGDCPTVSRSCFCELPDPLRCVWQASPGNDWKDKCRLEAEDWLDTVCGSQNRSGQVRDTVDLPFATQKVLFDDAIPKRTRDCLYKNVFNRGCFTYKRNCFCSAQNLFGCHDMDSSPEEKDLVTDWYAGVCRLSKDAARAAINEKAEEQPLSRIKIRWYEGLAIAILGVTLFVSVFYGSWYRNHRMEKLRKAKRATLKVEKNVAKAD